MNNAPRNLETFETSPKGVPASGKERPILFSAPMVRAILEGRKTQTRRVLKPTPIGSALVIGSGVYPDRYNKSDAWAFWLPDNRMTEPRTWTCPYGVSGDRLWVRETWAPHADESQAARNWTMREGFTSYGHDRPQVFYRADGGDPFINNWRPSIHMPRWASRITLEVTDVRVERLQDISEDDALAEGVEEVNGHPIRGAFIGRGPCYREGFAQVWADIHGDDSWDANPWVWVVGFERVQP